MSEPTITIEHQATLQPSPVNLPQRVRDSSPLASGTPIDQYQPPMQAGPDRYQEPHQFMQNPAVSLEQASQPATPSAPANQPTQPAQPTQTTQTEQTAAQPDPNANNFPGVSKPINEEIVVEWSSASRPHKQRQKQYFTTIAIFVFLLSLILFFLSQFLLIGVVMAVAFLIYVLEVVPPTMVNHQITTFGIRVENNLYYWDELGRFWFTEKYGQPMLHVEAGRFPGRLTLMLGDIPENEMAVLLSEVLIQQRPQPTLFEKAADRLQQLIPLENDKPSNSSPA